MVERLRPAFPALLGLAFMMCPPADGPQPPRSADASTKVRQNMVADQIAARGVSNPRVLEAMRVVPRHLFVLPADRDSAYDDSPIPIGHGQTISQPYIVALMSALARPAPGDRALEIGTGSGYQAAVLSKLVDRVFTIELIEELATTARARLADLGLANITVRQGDGYQGWPEEAPFDVILVTAAPPEIPDALVGQLRAGGRMVVPVGPIGEVQQLILIEKDSGGHVSQRNTIPVRFVPMVRKK